MHRNSNLFARTERFHIGFGFGGQPMVGFGVYFASFDEWFAKPKRVGLELFQDFDPLGERQRIVFLSWGLGRIPQQHQLGD